MRALFLRLDELSGRLDQRTRRILLLVSMAGLTLFASSTVAAIDSGDGPDTVAGFILLLLFAAGAAIACTKRARRG